MTVRTHDAYINSETTASQSVALLLGLAGLGSQKIPKYETEHGQDDHQNRPEYFPSRIPAALKDVDDGPDIGNQNDETEQALVLHFLSSLLFLRRYAAPLRTLRESFANGSIVHFARHTINRTPAMALRLSTSLSNSC